MTSVALKPLADAAGKSASYKRYPDVEQEIQKVLTQPPDDWPGLLGELKSETLVYLVRYHHPEMGPKVLGHVCNALSARALKIIRNNAKGFDPVTTEMIAEDVQSRMMIDAFKTDTATQLFLECNFHVSIERRTLNETAHYTGRREKAKRHAEEQSPEDELDIDHHDGFQDLVATHTRAALAKALEAVKDPRHREALVLRYAKGWPIRGKKLPTLCSHFGVTSRQIQNWLKIGKAQARATLGEKP